MTSRFGPFVALAALLTASSTRAAPIPIINHSFEEPVLVDGTYIESVPGWTRTGPFNGVFNPDASTFPAGVPQGQNAAFLDGGSTLTQRTAAILQPNTTYSLTVEYGAQASFSGIAPRIALRAGNFDLVESSATTPAPAGTFQTLSISLSTSDGHGGLGQSVDIILSATGPGIQVNYDNIRLNATPLPAAECVSPRQFFVAPGADQSYFGLGLAASDDTVVIFGGPYQTLRFYTRSGNTWNLTQTLTTPPIVVQTLPMALEGDTLVLGADRDSTTVIASGAVHMLRRTGGVWAYDELLTAAVPEFNARFGTACDIQGDRIIVGSPGAALGQGNAAVFRRSGETWTLEQTLVPAGSGNHLFGLAVAIDGEYAFLGSQLNTVAVFKRSGNTWAEIDPIQGDQFTAFGRALDTDEGTLIVGAPGESDSEGAAYFFRLFGDQWLLEERVTQPDPLGSDFFGQSVRISGGRAVVFAPNYGDQNDNHFGFLCIYQRGPFNWSFLEQLDKRDPDPTPDPIDSIALGGSTILMSDRINDDMNSERRLVATFDLAASIITQQPQGQIVNPGSPATLAIHTSTPNTTYRWRKNGVPLSNGGAVSGALSPTLTINPANASHTGEYDCVVTQIVGCLPIVSSDAFLAVADTTPACPGDANTNGEVEFSDITFVLQNWGIACP